jgi:hypothetical protein
MNTSLARVALLAAILITTTAATAQTPPTTNRAAASPGTGAESVPAKARHEDQVTLVIHTAANCPICRVWRESTTGWPLVSQLRQEWPQLQVAVIERPSIHGSESEALYPESLRHLFRARQESYQLSPATPLFEIVRNKQVVARQSGLNGWSDAVLPALRQLQASQTGSTGR